MRQRKEAVSYAERRLVARFGDPERLRDGHELFTVGGHQLRRRSGGDLVERPFPELDEEVAEVGSAARFVVEAPRTLSAEALEDAAYERLRLTCPERPRMHPTEKRDALEDDDASKDGLSQCEPLGPRALEDEALDVREHVSNADGAAAVELDHLPDAEALACVGVEPRELTRRKLASALGPEEIGHRPAVRVAMLEDRPWDEERGGRRLAVEVHRDVVLRLPILARARERVDALEDVAIERTERGGVRAKFTFDSGTYPT